MQKKTQNIRKDLGEKKKEVIVIVIVIVDVAAVDRGGGGGVVGVRVFDKSLMSVQLDP